MSLTVLSEVKLSALKAPHGAVLHVQEIELEHARRLTQQHGVNLPRPPAYRADRICEALELPREYGHQIKIGDQFLVCECPGFRAVLFYLVEFAADLEPDDEDNTIDPFEEA